jgi:hypothetical protein
MAIDIVPYTAEWEPAVRSFNQRLTAQTGPILFQFPERHVNPWIAPPGDGRRLYSEAFLAIEDGTTVRGGYNLKTQDFLIDGQVLSIGNLGLPLSEGVVDPRYGFLGVQLIRDAVRRQPLIYCLGMGGIENPLPRLLRSFKWAVFLVPFLFWFSRPGRCLRQIPRLRSTRVRRLASDLLAITGAAWIGVKLARVVMSRRVPKAERCGSESVAHFTGWTDETWASGRADYLVSAVRDATTMESLYGGPGGPNLHILKITRRGTPIGWALVSDSNMKGHRHFGDLRVGSLIDGFARAKDVPAVIGEATLFLEGRGVDLIVSNQSHKAWLDGLKSSGFMNGPSNFVLALSKNLAAIVAPWETRKSGFHFNRGDGDGPINL